MSYTKEISFTFSGGAAARSTFLTLWVTDEPSDLDYKYEVTSQVSGHNSKTLYEGDDFDAAFAEYNSSWEWLDGLYESRK